MAWGEVNVENQRKLFCLSVLDSLLSLAEACRQFQISRPTGYEWLGRYKKDGEQGLKNLSSARKTQPNTTPPDIVEQVIAFKRANKQWGPKKLGPKLKEKYPLVNWPSTTTIGKILSNNGLTEDKKTRKRLAANPSGLTESEKSNDVWCMDFKGWSITKDGYKFDPFTLSDHHSRYLLRSLKLNKNDADHVWALLDIVFREYGLPYYLRSDNGPPFATCSPGRLSALSIKLVKAGVMPEWIEPGKPQQNGRHERMHLTMEQEGFSTKTLVLEEQKMKLKEFQHYYNFERPHEALGQKTPGSIYKPSNRTWTGRFEPIEYSDEYKRGKVRSCGRISWKGTGIYIGRVFEGEYLGIKEGENGLEVYFGPIYLGILRDNELKVERMQTRKKPRGINEFQKQES
jgi:putative transposase